MDGENDLDNEETPNTPPAPPANPPAPASKLFTEEDVKRIVKERLARVKAGDNEDPSFKEALATAQKAEKAALAREAEATKLAGELLSEKQNFRTQAELERYAVQNGVKTDPKVIEKFVSLLDRSAIKVGEDGKITGVEEIVKAAVKEDWATGFLAARQVRPNDTNPPVDRGSEDDNTMNNVLRRGFRSN